MKKISDYSPICLFTYNRLEETKKTIEALQLNNLAPKSDLYIFSDGWKNEEGKEKINKVRSFLKTITGFKKITIFESDINKGLAKSIVLGVTKIVNIHGKVIVLEDDIITAKGFLKYMNRALTYYENVNEVMQISSFMFPIKGDDLPDTFFYQANTCWGWGTWKRSWIHYNDDGLYLLNQLQLNNISWKEFNSLQGSEFKKQLLKNINGTMKTWAVKWHAAIKLNKGKVLHPRYSYVSNIGFSGNGENCKKGEIMGEINNTLNLDVSDAKKKDNSLALERLSCYFKHRYSLKQKIIRKIESYL